MTTTPEWCVKYRYVDTAETVRVWVLAESREQAIAYAEGYLAGGAIGARVEFVDAVQTTAA
ncbi:hypothetical protein RVV79_003847 [Burkholderia contaminans]|nr:hypothetical protein [Burkholderia contaminans]